MVARSPLISIHALLAESDYHMPPVHVQLSIFLSTLSLRRATLQGRHSRAGTRDFYPRSPCGERPTDMRQRRIKFGFLSTLSLRRATQTDQSVWIPASYFYPRSPCGERRNGHPDTHRFDAISIHALLAESDRFHAADISASRISIHALLAESDLVRMLNSPHGEISIHALLAESDQNIHSSAERALQFLSTLSLRRATVRKGTAGRINGNFYPRSPCGERPGKNLINSVRGVISIHALLAESDSKSAQNSGALLRI